MRLRFQGKILLLLLMCYHANAYDTTNFTKIKQVKCIKAFAKIYGYVRYFHPSDEANNLDWEKFAIYGIKKVKDKEDNLKLKNSLDSLFLGFTVGFQLSDNKVIEESFYKTRDTDKVVFWQHHGLEPQGLTSPNSKVYYSIRTNRPNRLQLKTLWDIPPQFQKTIQKEINEELFCKIPLVLELNEGRTFPKPLTELREYVENALIDVDPNFISKDLLLANVVIVWNMVQHFYPYPELLKDWDNKLEIALLETLESKTTEEYIYVVNKMLELLGDGHAIFYYPQLASRKAFLPIRIDYLEGQVVVTNSIHPSIQKGDILLTIDNVKANEILESKMKYISGSNQWKIQRALTSLIYGNRDQEVVLVLKRKQKTFNISTRINQILLSTYLYNKVEQLEDKIFYIDLTRTSLKEIEEMLITLETAKGIIFDLRGYPNDNINLIAHLTEEEVKSPLWIVPLIMFPDMENILKYDTSQWTIKPKKPTLKSKVIFITNGSAISYSETFLSIVDHYKLAEIVGESTGGANGNAYSFILPANFFFNFTGMKVLKQDGSPHNLIGIQPSLKYSNSIEGVSKQKDELIERSIQLIKKH